MGQQIYLGIDLGAESGRVMAGCWNGRQIRVEELYRFPNGAVEVAGTLRWDVLRLWSEVQNGLGLAAKRFGKSIKSIGVDTWGVDYVLLSKSGEMLGWPFSYRDSRTRGCLDAALQRLSRTEIFANTGAQFMEINTLYQWLAHYRASPEMFGAADSFLMIPDWFNWCLTGVKSVEFTNATTTQFFHPAKRAWSWEMLDRLGLPTHLLPAVVDPGTRLGTLGKSLADRISLSQVSVVAPATHDTGSAVAAIPTEFTGRSHWAYISSGTWSLVGIETSEPQLSPRALELNVTNEGGVDGTWRVLKNVMGLWLLQRCRAAFETRGGSVDYGVLVKLAEAATPLRCFVNPDDQRFLNPPDMPAALRSFCRETNQRCPETEGEFVRCVLENLALKYSLVLSELEELSGERIEVIHIVGGGARNALLNQFTADACGRAVIAGPIEATVLGNVLVQARSFGELRSIADLRETVRTSSELNRFDPQPGAAAHWLAAREQFRQLLQSTP